MIGMKSLTSSRVLQRSPKTRLQAAGSQKQFAHRPEISGYSRAAVSLPVVIHSERSFAAVAAVLGSAAAGVIIGDRKPSRGSYGWVEKARGRRESNCMH